MNKKLIRQLIVKAGRTKSIIAITVTSVLFSECISLFAMFAFHGVREDPHTRFDVGIVVGFIVPLIVAPAVSWILIDLILEIDELEQKMRSLATYDGLTGLLNRRAFLEQARYGCQIAERENLIFSLLMVDVDHFKKINDQYGHAVGDLVLESFGKAANHIKRRSDLAGRFGGEEFVFFLPNTPSDKAWIFAERLHEAIRATVIKNNEALVQYTVSIGLASFSEIANIETALVIADKALYEAKEKGRNRTLAVENTEPSIIKAISLP